MGADGGVVSGGATYTVIVVGIIVIVQVLVGMREGVIDGVKEDVMV